MPIFSSLMFRAVRWVARRGLREEEGFSRDAKKLEAQRTGARGETYAYWYLRRNAYVFVARNYSPALPEPSVTRDKQSVVIRTAQRSLAERRPPESPRLFDVVAIDNIPWLPPVVRLHKDTFGPQM